MVFDRARAQVEHLGDLPGQLAGYDQIRDLSLPPRKRRPRCALGRHAAASIAKRAGAERWDGGSSIGATVVHWVVSPMSRRPGSTTIIPGVLTPLDDENQVVRTHQDHEETASIAIVTTAPQAPERAQRRLALSAAPFAAVAVFGSCHRRNLL
jgi:hypothetical protein